MGRFYGKHDEERTAYKQSQWGDGVLKTDLDARMNQLALNTTSSLPFLVLRWFGSSERWDMTSLLREWPYR